MNFYTDWVKKAEHDLRTAKIILATDSELTDTAVYHTQQCAEKMLKAFLVNNDIFPEKTHNLRVLLLRCIEINPSFEQLMPIVAEIVSFDTLYRYPGEEMLPDIETAHSAIAATEQIFSYINQMFIQ